MKKILKQILMIIPRALFYVLDWVVPKNNHLAVFAQQDIQYIDNGKALHDFINSSKCPGWEAIWIYDGAKKDYYPKSSVELNSVKMFIVALRARFFVRSYGRNAFGHYLYSPRTKMINVWHGIAIKAMQYFDLRYANANHKRLAYRCASDLQCVSSQEDLYHMSATFQLPPANFAITGLPRTDRLFSTIKDSKVIELPGEILSKKTILYAPTHRDEYGTASFFPLENFDINKLNELLIELDAYLLLREHKGDKGKLSVLTEYCSLPETRIYQAHSDKVRDISDLLPFVDVVITDYSSIYLDLLLTNTPCVFIPYDLVEYEKYRGLAYHYEDVTPGPKVLSFDSFITALQDALQGAPLYQKQRDKVKRLFHQYADGKSCERVVKEMKKMIRLD